MFATLGLTALVMIGLATAEMTHFVAGSAGHPRVPLAMMPPAKASRNDGWKDQGSGALRAHTPPRNFSSGEAGTTPQNRWRLLRR